MLIGARRIRGWAIRATNGDIGRANDLYFDDERWVVRYLVVDTGGWLRGRKVLVSPYAVKGVDSGARAIAVTLTREQVAASPDIDTDKPVSRQQEAEYHRYYGYPEYWPYTTFWAWGATPVVVPPDPSVREELEERRRREAEREAEHADAHLRSASEVIGYHIQATDAPIGHVDDCLFEDDTWAIRYLVVDTRNWLPGRQVLVAPQWIREASWSERSVVVDLSRRQIEACPEYDPSHPPPQGYEAGMGGTTSSQAAGTPDPGSHARRP